MFDWKLELNWQKTFFSFHSSYDGENDDVSLKIKIFKEYKAKKKDK